MARPLRIEFADAVYHVTSRGDRREAIYRDDEDRQRHLAVIAQAMDRFDAQVLAYCLMGNHYHLVVQTRQANLSRLMRHINGITTQQFNRRHGLVGHLFQGRFKAILVDRDAYLLALCRYVERNPVAAGLVGHAGDWPWSSYQAHVGQAESPRWLDSAGLYAHLLGRPADAPAAAQQAAAQYAAMVATVDEARSPSIWTDGLRQQIYLGNDDFVARMQARLSPERLVSPEIPAAQRVAPTAPRQPKSFQDCLAECGTRNQALAMAYREGGMTMPALAAATGLSVSRVSRLMAAFERVEATGKT